MPKVLLGCISTAMYGVKAYPEATVNLSGGSFADISNCSLSLTASTAYISGLVDAAICLGEEASLYVSGPLTEGSKISLVETYLSYGQSVDIAPESEYITEKTPGYFSSPDGYEIYAENGGLKMKNNFGEPVFDASTGVLTLSGKVDVSQITDMTAMFAGDVKLKTIIVGTQWSNYLVEESPGVFDRCTNLVGQDGTAYDQDHTDQTYARVDGYDGEKG